MGILTYGRDQAFENGLENVITQMKLFGTAGQVGATKSITVSHDSNNLGRANVDNPVEFSVNANDTVTNIQLVSASNSLVWQIDLAESYTFSVDGTFTVESAFVQFNFNSDAINTGGLTDLGARALITTGWTDVIDTFGTVTTDGSGGTMTTQTVYTDTGVSEFIGSTVFSVSNGTFSFGNQTLAQIYIDFFEKSVEKFFLVKSGTVDENFFYLFFSTAKNFPYPNNLTIQGFDISIN